VDLLGPRGPERAKAARKEVTFAVVRIRLVLHRPNSFRRVDGRVEPIAVAPGRALVTLRREADRLHGRESLELRVGEGERIDEDGAAALDNGVRVGLCAADALVSLDRPAKHAGHDLFERPGGRLRFRHGRLS
jgi:hypothetical protein